MVVDMTGGVTVLDNTWDTAGREQEAHHTHSLSQIQTQLVKGANCDVTLVCSDGVETCHGAMLAAGSLWWRTVLGNPSEELQTVLLPDWTRAGVRGLLAFLYTGNRRGTGLESTLGLLASLLPDISLQVKSGENGDIDIEAFKEKVCHQVVGGEGYMSKYQPFPSFEGHQTEGISQQIAEYQPNHQTEGYQQTHQTDGYQPTHQTALVTCWTRTEEPDLYDRPAKITSSPELENDTKLNTLTLSPNSELSSLTFEPNTELESATLLSNTELTSPSFSSNTELTRPTFSPLTDLLPKEEKAVGGSSRTDVVTINKDLLDNKPLLEDENLLDNESLLDNKTLQDNKTLLDSTLQLKKQQNNKSCSECGKTFLYPKDLKKHQLVHQQVFPFTCAICSKGVRTISNMYKHLRLKHGLQDNLKTHILDQQGTVYIHPEESIKQEVKAGNIDLALLDPDHVMEAGPVGQNKNGVNLFRCLVCDKHVTKYSLKNHLSVHTGQDKFKCQLCPRSYFTSSALSNHQISSHEPGSSQLFKCPTCYRTFRSGQVRDHHASNCLQVDPAKRKTAFECRICNKLFGYKNNLASHQKNVHGLEGKRILEYPCKHCGQLIKGKLKLSKHIIAAHPDAVGELCDLCGKSFKTEMKLLRHISVHKTRERNLHCSFCPKKFFRRDVLTVHEKVHTAPLICQECGKKFPEQRYLDTHMDNLHNEKKRQCSQCPRTFSTDDQLRKHKETDHSAHGSPTKYSCKICSQEFMTKSDLSRHKQEKADHFPLQCPTCGKGFLHDSQLQKHQDQVHFRASPGLVICPHCEAGLGSLYSLKRHLAKHKCPLVAGEEHCPVCVENPETFFKLRNHIRVNENKKVLPCGLCERKFKTVQELRVHGVVHSGHKPFPCDLCGERFTQKCSLVTHMARHKAGTVGRTTFSCPVCSKICRTFAALKSHTKSHQGLEVTKVLEEGQTLGPSFPHVIFQPEPGSLLEQSQQFQVTTINIAEGGLEGPGTGLENLITIDPAHLASLSRAGPLELVGETGEYKIQIIDELPTHI